METTDEIFCTRCDASSTEIHIAFNGLCEDCNIELREKRIDENKIFDVLTSIYKEKKSILILGAQSTGKTLRLNQLLHALNEEDRATMMTFKNFFLTSKIELKSKFNFIGIDEVANNEQIEYLVDSIHRFGFILIIASQMNQTEISERFLASFEIVNLRK